MTQCSSIDATLLSSQLNKLKSATKNETGVTLRSNLSAINSDNETNFLQIFLMILQIIHQLKYDYQV